MNEWCKNNIGKSTWDKVHVFGIDDALFITRIHCYDLKVRRAKSNREARKSSHEIQKCQVLNFSVKRA